MMPTPKAEVAKKQEGGLDDLLAEIKIEVEDHEVEKAKTDTEKSKEGEIAKLEVVEKLKTIDDQMGGIRREEDLLQGKAVYFAVADNPQGYEASLKQKAQANTERNNLEAEAVILGEESGIKPAPWNEIRASDGIEGIKKNAFRNRDENNKNNERLLNETGEETFEDWSRDLKKNIAEGRKNWNTEGWMANEKSAQTPDELAKNLQKTFVEYFDKHHMDGGYGARFDSKGMIPSWSGFLEQGYGLALAALESSDAKTAATALAFTEGIRTMPPQVLERVKAALAGMEPSRKKEFLETLEQEKKKQIDYKKELEAAKKHITVVPGENQDWWVK